MDHTRLDGRELPSRGDRLREALQPIADRDADVLHAGVLDLGEDAQPELRALAAIAGPEPEDVALAVDGHADHDIHRLVRDLSVTDLDDHCVNEDHRVDLAAAGSAIPSSPR